MTMESIGFCHLSNFSNYLDNVIVITIFLLAYRMYEVLVIENGTHFCIARYR